MKHLFQSATVHELKERLARLHAESYRSWGTMNPAQALAHCSMAFEMALGEINPPRRLLGLLIGRHAKRSLVDKAERMRSYAPTAERLIVRDERDFIYERQRLSSMIDHFATEGPEHCTTHPHYLLGSLSAIEWAALMYQHLDHHFRQFQV
jgi:hypothetical protein